MPEVNSCTLKTNSAYVPVPFTELDYAQYAIYLRYCYDNGIQVEDLF